MTLSYRREGSCCVRERDLIVDSVVALARRVSLHRGAAIKHATRNLRLDWKNVEARVPFRAAPDERVNDGTGMDRRWEARRRQHDLELVTNPDNSSAADGCTCGADHRVDEKRRDVVTIRARRPIAPALARCARR